MKPISLAEDFFWKTIPESAGVYHIYSYKDKKPLKINRVLRLDNEGVLYIGKSDNLRERLRILKKNIIKKPQVSTHTFGKKHNENKRLQKAFPLASLFVKYQISEDSKKLEKDLLDQYFQKFGEVPPFNSSK
jgi:hypothetical protein